MNEEVRYEVVFPEDRFKKKQRDRIRRQLTAHMKTFGKRDVWGETFNPWADPNYTAQK